jgi:sporulation protein YlmC with PRC-barrel domain
MDTFEKKYETDNLTGQNQEGPRANTPVRRLTATSIIGDKVENLEGEDLGTIKNLMINLETGNVQYVVLQFGGFLGMGDKLFAIPFSELSVDPLREIFVLNRDKEYLKQAPGFDQDHWPDTNDHYYTETDAYWGSSVEDRPYPHGDVII